MSQKLPSLDTLFREVNTTKPVEYSDIPSIDLYMDQITTFMDENLACYKRSTEEKVLTKTMINNYAKAKVFPPPVKKKYTKNHIMLLIIIYHLKSILSINDITKLLKPITSELEVGKKSETLELVYKTFVILQKHSDSNILADFTGEYSKIEQNLDESGLKLSDDIKLILTVLLLSIQADCKKRIAEKIIDEYI